MRSRPLPSPAAEQLERINSLSVLTLSLALAFPSAPFSSAAEAQPGQSPQTSIETVQRKEIRVSDFRDYAPGQKIAGTLRAALEEAGPGEHITFAQPGTVQLVRPLDVTAADVHLDGSQNPVVIIGDTVRVKASGVRVNDLWIFAGDALPDPNSPGKKGHSKGADRDALVIWGGDSEKAQIENVSIENCWLGFGIDECVSTFGHVKNVRIINNIIGYGLNRSIHPDDKKRRDVPGHGKGVLIGVGADGVEFSRNLLIHNFDRNIQVRGGTNDIRFIGNVIYNWGRGNTFYAGDDLGTSSGVIAGNLFLAGENSGQSSTHKFATPATASNYKVVGNSGPVNKGTPLSDSRIFNSEPLNEILSDGEQPINSAQALRALLSTVGPRPDLDDQLSRDAIEQVVKRSGTVIDFLETKINPEAEKSLGFVPILERIISNPKADHSRSSAVRTVPEF